MDVSWTPDLFGRIRSQVHAAQYSAQVSAADLENERLIEQADLAEFYFEIRGQDALIELYTQTVAQYQKSLDLTQAQYDTGVGDQISVVEARTTLQSAQASLTNLGILRAQYEHAIAVLIGKPASAFSLPLVPSPPRRHLFPSACRLSCCSAGRTLPPPSEPWPRPTPTWGSPTALSSLP